MNQPSNSRASLEKSPHPLSTKQQLSDELSYYQSKQTTIVSPQMGAASSQANASTTSMYKRYSNNAATNSGLEACRVNQSLGNLAPSGLLKGGTALNKSASSNPRKQRPPISQNITAEDEPELQE